MLKKIFFSLFLVLPILVFSLSFNAQSVYGQGIIPDDQGSHCPPGYKGNCGDYELNDFIVLAVNVSKWILGIVGSLTLLMFIYGGLTFLISAGSSDKIQKAKDILVAAVIGLIIVFASWLIIRFVMQSLGRDWNGTIMAALINQWV